jgi:hypothetical protein
MMPMGIHRQRRRLRMLERQDGSCVLVGHSYSGAVITEAGTDSHVAALV